MEIKNIDGLSVSQIKQLVNEGGKFVIFPYAISIVIMSFKRNSNIYFIRSGENSLSYSYPFVLLNLVLGWWGFPWGPIYTIGSLYRHIMGGQDITQEVLSHLIQHDPDADTSTYGINNLYNNGGEQEAQSSNNSNSVYNIPRN
jgi:hypothetical protein